MMRMTFPESDEASILTDLSHVLTGKAWKVIWSHVRVENETTVTGFHLVNGWGPERYLYFAAKYSRPFDNYQIISDGKPVVYDSYKNYRFRSRTEAAGANLQFLAEYKTKKDEPILVKVGDLGGQRGQRLEESRCRNSRLGFREGPQRHPREMGPRTEQDPNRRLAGGKGNLLHRHVSRFTTPNLYQDVTGEYRGLDQNIHKAEGFTNYAVFSLWDTYRAEHPLFALIQAERDADMINSMLAHYDQSVDHLLPIWSLPGNETWCMIGYHAVPVIVDAYLKGVKGFDAERAYQGDQNHGHESRLRQRRRLRQTRLGALATRKTNRSRKRSNTPTTISASRRWPRPWARRTITNISCTGRPATRTSSIPRSASCAARIRNGKWREPFDPHGHADITEGTSWQYSWYVPHDVPGLIALARRQGEVHRRSSTNSSPSASRENSEADDIQRRHRRILARQRAEPSHHLPLLLRRPDLEGGRAPASGHEDGSTATSRTRSRGNDDCGQMSAWYIFTALGFYPVCPGSDYYVIGSPAREEGRDASLQRQDIHGRSPKISRRRTSTSSRSSSTARIGPSPSCPIAK